MMRDVARLLCACRPLTYRERDEFLIDWQFDEEVAELQLRYGRSAK